MRVYWKTRTTVLNCEWLEKINSCMQCANTLTQAKSVIPYALVDEIIGQAAGYFKPHERSIAPSSMEYGQKRKKF